MPLIYKQYQIKSAPIFSLNLLFLISKNFRGFQGFRQQQKTLEFSTTFFKFSYYENDKECEYIVHCFFWIILMFKFNRLDEDFECY